MRLARLARLMLLMPLLLSAPRTLLGQWARPAQLRTLARRAQLALLVHCGRDGSGLRLEYG